MSLGLSPGIGDVITLVMVRFAALTATASDICAKAVVPCKGRIVGVQAVCAAIGGTTEPTDVDLMVEKGTTDVLSAAIPVVDGSAIQSPAQGTLVTTPATLAVAEGDILTVDATVAGGSSPTATGIVVTVHIARE